MDPKFNLTKEEQRLHHDAAMLKKKLQAYRACEPRDEKAWKDEFRAILVSLYLCSDSCKKCLLYVRQNQ
jgi:hypothetical protein